MYDPDTYYPDLEQFRKMSQRGNLIPIYKTILADLETPVSAFYKIRSGDYDFLLESVEGGENVARYSLLGSHPSLLFQSKGQTVTVRDLPTETVESYKSQDPLRDLEKTMQKYQPVVVEGLPRFHGGAVGFLSYDMVRFFEDFDFKPSPAIDLGSIVYGKIAKLALGSDLEHFSEVRKFLLSKTKVIPSNERQLSSLKH